MARPPSLPVADKQWIILSILSGEMTVAETSRRDKASEASIHRWKAQFLEGRRTGLADGGAPGRGTVRVRELDEENEQLKLALGEATVQIRVWQKSAEHQLGPTKTSR